jgi:Tfp pilus assembly protein PilO
LFSKFISGLSPKERKVLAFAAIIVLAALFDRLLVAPSMNRLHAIENNITEQQKIIEQNMRFLAHRDRIIKEAAVYKDFYAKGVQTEEAVIADFLKKIESLATQSQVALVKVSPDGQDFQKDYLKYLVTLDCSGKLENITNFLYAVNSSPELLKVEKMNLLANARDTEKIQATITISKMIMGPDPTVEAKSLVKVKEEPAVAPPVTPQQ